MKKIVDMEEWNKFYQRIIDDLNFNDASDYGYGHGIKKANDWLELNSEEEKRGKWVRKEDENMYWHECSNCGSEPLYDPWKNVYFSNYCPNCGWRMDLGEEE